MAYLKILTNTALDTLLDQPAGTGWLILKTRDDTWLELEVYVRPDDGVLCRSTDGNPVTSIDIIYDEDGE